MRPERAKWNRRSAAKALRFVALALGWATLIEWDVRAEEPVAPPVIPPPAHASSEANLAWEPQRFARLVANLSDEQFSVRDSASHELASAPSHMLGMLVAEARKQEDPETRKRLSDAGKNLFMEQILRQLGEWKVGRGFLGIQWTISQEPPGVSAVRILGGTAAERAGLADGDTIVGIDGKTFEAGFSTEEATKIWKAMAPGDSMVLAVRRGGQAGILGIKTTIGEVPEEFRNPEADQQKAEVLWTQFEDGTLKIPESLLHPAPKAAPAEPKTKGAVTAEPVQSWPLEYEAPKTE